MLAAGRLRHARAALPVTIILVASACTREDSPPPAPPPPPMKYLGIDTEQWIHQCFSSSTTERWAAFSAVTAIGPEAAEAVPALVRALEDDGTNYRAALALRELGPKASDALPHLVAAIQKRSGDGRHVDAYLDAICSVDADSSTCLEILGYVLDDPAAPVSLQASAVMVLSRHGDRAGRFAERILALVHVPDQPLQLPQLSGAAIHALGKIGKAARCATSDLEEMLRKDPGRSDVAAALFRIDPGKFEERCKSTLLHGLRSQDLSARNGAAGSLVELMYTERLAEAWKPECEEELRSVVVSMMREGDEVYAAMGAKYLAEMRDPRAIPMLVDLLYSEYEDERPEAVEGLVKVGKPDPVVLRHLARVKDKEDESFKLRRAAANALLSLERRRSDA